jgi:hypothetical protein
MAYKNSWTNNTPASPCTVNITPAAGDIEVGAAITDSAGDTCTLPTGWTAVTGTPLQSTADGMTLFAFSRKSSAESSVVYDATHDSIGNAASFDGRDQTTWLDVTPVTFANSANGTTMDINITPATDGCDLVFVAALDDGNSNSTFTFTTTAGTTGAWTTRVDQNNGFLNLAIGTCTQVTAGAITARCTTSDSGGRCGVLFALRPAAGGGGGSTRPLIVPAILCPRVIRF